MLQRLHLNTVCSCKAAGLHTRMGHAITVFRSCGRAFSKAVLRTRALCNLEQFWVGYGGLSTENTLSEGKRHMADPGNHWTLRAIVLFLKACTLWGKWPEAAFLSSSGDTRTEAEAGQGFYFRPSLGTATVCYHSGWPRWEKKENCSYFVQVWKCNTAAESN